MILTCPSCNTRYFARNDSLGSQGRTVRCASCGHKWHATREGPSVTLEVDELRSLEPPAPPQAQAAPDSSPDPQNLQPAAASIRRAVQDRRSERARQTGWRLWGVVSMGVAAALVAAVFAREDVVKVWPKSASAFALIGLKATDTGLQFAEVTADRITPASGPVLSLKTTVENLTGTEKLIPFVRVSVQDENAREVGAWIIAMDQAVLSPRERVRVTASIPAPPKDGRKIRLAFVDKPDLATPIVYGHSDRSG